MGPESGTASSHREAPLIAGDPRVDNTDLYAFVSPDRPDTVTLLANYIPFEEPNGGPNFYSFATDARYNIKIDNDGDANPDVVYRFTFRDHDRRGGSTFLYNKGPVTSLNDPDLLFKQQYIVQRITAHGSQVVASGIVAPSNVGPASMPDYATLRRQAVRPMAGGGRAFAGQADEAFFLDLRVFDLLYGGNLKEVGQDSTRGYNVNTIALQVPKRDLALHGDARHNPVIGIWATADRLGPRGYRQVSRLGNPLVNEVVVPAGLKDQFNRTPPVKDASIAPLVARVTHPEVPQLIEQIYKIPAPKTPRNDLAEIFLTGIAKGNGPIKADLNSQLLNRHVAPKAFRPSEQLRLNMAIPPTARPNRLGVLGGDLQGFPNGRRLGDDVVDIELQALEGAAVTGKLVDGLTDKVDANDKPQERAFPYIPLPSGQGVNVAGAS